MRNPLLLSLLFTATLAQAQTYFYINGIQTQPASPTVSDAVSLQLIGDLSSTGAYVVSADAQVAGNLVTITIQAADNGGLAVLVPHTETIALGMLPAGDYQVVFSLGSMGVLDLAGQDEHFFTVSGDSPCADLDIVSVQWHAFSDTLIMVHAQNNGTSGEIFDYPNFILFDDLGDTLAKETVNFFGIGVDSWHALRVLPGVAIPSTVFDGRLELWTGFTQNLACDWDTAFDLCPPLACATFLPSMGNYGGALVLGTFNWEVWDAMGTSVGTGQFEMTPTVQYDSDTLCLPPGEYMYLVSPIDPPSGGGPMFFVTDESGYGTELSPIVWSLPVSQPVHFYAPCTEGTNGIGERDAGRYLVRYESDSWIVERTDGRTLGHMALFEAGGKLVRSWMRPDARAVLAMPPAGMYLLRVGDEVIRLASTEQR